MADGTDVQSLLDDAAEATGLDDFGDDWFLTPLAAWSRDLEQENLTDFGRRFFRSQAVRDLSRRLRVLDTLRHNPEIAEVEIPPIVYITGLERSGTTLLHNLLALADGARSLLRWELMEPVPPPEAATAATDPRIAAVQAAIDPLRGSLLEQMHWVDADDPEECVWGFIDCLSFLGQAAGMCMPEWGEVVQSGDHTRAFEHHRQLIQLLTWKHPVPDGGHLVLKAPQIAVHLDQFAAVFPEAHFVVPDRDPFRCLVSIAVMVRSIVEPFCEANPVTEGSVDLVQRVSNKLGAVMTYEDAHPGAITHVPYPDLVEDPVATVRSVCAATDVGFDEGFAARIEAFLAEQRSGKRAAPPRRIETPGFDHDDVRSSPVVAHYCERYAIDPERTRLSG